MTRDTVTQYPTRTEPLQQTTYREEQPAHYDAIHNYQPHLEAWGPIKDYGRLSLPTRQYLTRLSRLAVRRLGCRTFYPTCMLRNNITYYGMGILLEGDETILFTKTTAHEYATYHTRTNGADNKLFCSSSRRSAISTAPSFLSIPIQPRPCRSAATKQVPDPT